jgi:uncharacterized protein
MSEGWSRSRDVGLLADNRERFEGSIALAEFPRLREHLAESSGAAQVTVGFSRQSHLVIADVAVRASLRLTCQRCLRAMDWPVARDTRVALVPDLATADSAPEGVDAVLVEAGRASVLDLAEEEMLLALPLVPLHEDPADCGEASADAAPQDEPDETHKPFAQLGELLKRDRS